MRGQLASQNKKARQLRRAFFVFDSQAGARRWRGTVFRITDGAGFAG
jgi:hypothetical protein